MKFPVFRLLGEEAKNYSHRGAHWDSVVTPQLPSRSQLSDTQSLPCATWNFLKTGHPLQVFRIPITLHRNFRRRAVNFPQVVGCEFDFE